MKEIIAVLLFVMILIGAFVSMRFNHFLLLWFGLNILVVILLDLGKLHHKRH